MSRRIRVHAVYPKAPRACFWCPIEIPAGTRCTSWAAPDSAGKLRTRWAHVACDDEATNMIFDGQGEDDGWWDEPDPGCIPRTIGFFPDREELDRVLWDKPWHSDEDRAVWLALWDRVHGPEADLRDLAGVGPCAPSPDRR